MKRILFTALSLLLALPAMAEKADANKPITIDAIKSDGDNLLRCGEYLGNVVLTRGTLLVHADKASACEDDQGYSTIKLSAEPGKLAKFRQKRDGGDFWMEGEAERIEYDDKSETVKFFSRVTLRQLEGTRVMQEFTGNHFSFNNRTEKFAMLNDASGTTNKAGGTVRTVIAPKVIKPAAGKQ